MAGILFVGNTYCFASAGKPYSGRHFNCVYASTFVGDSIPATKVTAITQSDSSKAKSTIKEVPKSRKQPAPIALPAQVKVQPVKIVKPKIIKPVIKIH